MSVRELLSRMRRGEPAGEADIADFVRGLADGAVSDGQAGAFVMAVCTRGLGPAGRRVLTREMASSGRSLGWDLPGPVVDKHSTGGLGDCVSLVLAPALAALGCYVPMISGRSLGHTGGTLDKLEAIPGLDTELDEEAFRRVVREVGCANVAASEAIAPADRRLYAIRDLTGTVDHIDLIVPSILSKKLAAGLDALVLDVKVGSAAFMRDLSSARTLAEALVETAAAAGCPTTALLTDMDAPLAGNVGTALEIVFVMEVLTGAAADSRLLEVSAALGGRLLVCAGREADADAGAAAILRAISSGAAAERFAAMVAAMGGPGDFLDTWCERLPVANEVRDIVADEDGWLAAIDGRGMGEAASALGRGGAERIIDPAAGFSQVRRIGTRVVRGEVLARVHSGTALDADDAALRRLFQISAEPPAPRPLLLGEVR